MYLIDGNNLIGQRGRGFETCWQDKSGARSVLLKQLAVLARLRQTRLTVVFDGAPDDRFPEDTRYRGVRVLYAAPGSDADMRIVQLVEQEKNKRGLTVVTSDNQLAARVRVCGVQVMRAGAFRRWMEEAIETDSQRQAETASEDDESTAQWMRYFGVALEDDEDE
jgi:predicted RNA-binding protein with PIN domain